MTTHTTDLKAHVTALKERLATPTEDQPVGGHANGSSSKSFPPGGGAIGMMTTTPNLTLRASQGRTLQNLHGDSGLNDEEPKSLSNH